MSSFISTHTIYLHPSFNMNSNRREKKWKQTRKNADKRLVNWFLLFPSCLQLIYVYKYKRINAKYTVLMKRKRTKICMINETFFIWFIFLKRNTPDNGFRWAIISIWQWFFSLYVNVDVWMYEWFRCLNTLKERKKNYI